MENNVFQDNFQGRQVRIGFTHGDINGIGYEIIIKTLIDIRIVELITPVVFGISKVASYHRKTVNLQDFNFNLIKRVDAANPKRPNIFNIYDREVKIDLGISTDIAGQMAHLSLQNAVESIDRKEIDAIVTAPINKKNIQSKDFNFPGHTEFFADHYKVGDFLMLMIADNLRIGVITGHIPVKDVPETLSIDLVLKKVKIMHQSLRCDFAIRKPRIAVLGLNPHAGDNGLIGAEEQDILIPAIRKAEDAGMLVYGPYPADGFFGSSTYKKFDGILAIYHDQGMIPFKALAMENGVNFTAGLPIVRTSPAHGTAYDISGKDVADPGSMQAAVYLACDIFRNRQEWDELNQNPLMEDEKFNGDDDVEDNHSA
nr:4-hydroxythreonine-4-phosphate dehydrogenase PdxA [Bacteroidota bacterium]